MKSRIIALLDKCEITLGVYAEDYIREMFHDMNWLDYPFEWLEVFEELGNIATEIRSLRKKVEALEERKQA